MKFTKTITRTYDIEFEGTMKMTNADFIEERKRLGLKYPTTCFMCEKKLDMGEPVHVATVMGSGNIYICKECKTKLLEADNSNDDDA